MAAWSRQGRRKEGGRTHYSVGDILDEVKCRRRRPLAEIGGKARKGRRERKIMRAMIVLNGRGGSSYMRNDDK